MKRNYSEISQRLARKQATEDDVIEATPESAFYNIYYDKVEDFSKWHERRDAKIAGKRFKLDIEKDPGKTQADPETAYLCLHFARGKCIYGSACKFLHRLPNAEDDRRVISTHDIFGREKHAADRSDMGGVGSFNRTNHTLYISSVRTSAPDSEKKIRETFAAFGTIINMRLLARRGMAFITYSERTAAEFAKEAMADQPIFGREAINVRWAHADPNPKDLEDKKLELKKQAIEEIAKRDPINFQQNLALAQGHYPDTDSQYGGSAPPGVNLPAGGKPGEWVQVGDEATGYYWVYAGVNNNNDDTAPEGEGADLQAQAQADAHAQAQAQAENVEGLTEEQKQYQVFQTYYYQNGYPFYYEDSGRVVYYDPTGLDDETRRYYESRAQPPGGVPHVAEAAAQAQQSVGSYEQTAQTAVPQTSSEYHNHFSGYASAQPPPAQQNAEADKPLY